jgi:RNA polymerase sigma-70 factor, ECF subfamily
LGEEFPEILRRAAVLDGQAFASLWRDAHPPLLRYLRVASPDLAEDLASEVWLDVARRIGEFRGGEPEFRGWLFTLARRKVIDRLRYASRHPEAPTAETEILDKPAADDTVAAAFEQISTDAALALIKTLPKDQAEIIVLRVVGGLDAKQVAKIVNKSPGAVRIAAHRALRTLAAQLADPSRFAPTPGPAVNGFSGNGHIAPDTNSAAPDQESAHYRARVRRSTGGVTLCGDMSFLCL